MSAPDSRGRKARIVAVSNQKGGVGKTTTAVNLAASLAAAEQRVLLVDLDPQGNASSAVGYPRGSVTQGTYELLCGDVRAGEVLQTTELPALQVLPATADLSGAEVELPSVDEWPFLLRNALTELLDAQVYDYVVLDCPPSLGVLTINALVAATAVLIPMQAKYFSLEGLGALQETVDRVRESYNPELALEGIVFCMFDRRTNLAQTVVHEVKEHYGDDVFETVIPVNVRLSESPSFGKPALLYDIESRGAQAYLELAREVLRRDGARGVEAQA